MTPQHPIIASSTTLASPEEHWISVSDLMSLLMMVFLLISVVYQAVAENEKERIEEVAVLYNELRQDLYQDLLEEFRDDLPKWGAVVNEDLSIRFQEPDVLFESGRDELRPLFQGILSDFFPRYVAVLTSPKYVNDIEEVRIEGHTSSVCSVCSTTEESYFFNMELSQARTRSTLRYVLGLPSVEDSVEWLRGHVTANGLSFSHVVTDNEGNEDFAASRRVEFRVKTNAEERIARILTLASDE